MKLRYALPLLTGFALASPAIAQPGTLDPAFDGDGILTLQPGSLHDVAYDVIALADNSMLLCGVAQHNGTNAIFIAHLLEDESLDTGFGLETGYTFFNIGEEAYGYAMGRDSHGKIYVCGLAYPTLAQSVIVLVRTNSTGIPDAGFGTDGVVTVPMGTTDAEAKGLAVRQDDSVILAGSAVGADHIRHALFVGVKADGTLDPNFGVSGFTMADGLAGESLLNDVALMDNSTIMGVGYSDVGGAMKTIVLMCDIDGQFVGTFGNNGVLLPDIGMTDHSALGALASGNDLLVTGTVATVGESDIFVSKIKEDGTYDPGFAAGSPLLIDLNDYEVGFDLASANGQIYVCGTTGEPGFGVPRDFFVAKMNGEGVLNEAFGSGGAVVTSIQDDFDDANAMTIQPDGKLVAAGFTAAFSTGGDNDVAVVRYFDDGSLATASIQPTMGASIFPNPVVGSTVNIQTECYGTLRISIRDASGRLVRSLTERNTGVTFPLDIADLPSGHYVVHLTGQGRTEQHALVVQR